MEQAAGPISRIRVDGRPLAAFYDRWEATDVVRLSEEISCLILHDPDSKRDAVWYLDRDWNYRGSHIEACAHLTPDDILASLQHVFDDLARHSLTDRPVTPAGAPDNVPVFLAVQLASAWVVRHMSHISFIPTSRTETDATLRGPEGRFIPAQAFRRLLASRIGTGPLVVSSPFSGKPLRSQLSFIVEHVLVHRFEDFDEGAVFYLAWPERSLDQPPAFYCQRMQMIVSDHEHPGLLPGRILGWYLAHPEHVQQIAYAQEFQASDYGLGQASSLYAKPEKAEPSTTEEDDTAPSDSTSHSWIFLRQTEADGTLPVPTQTASDESASGSGIAGRLRSLFKKNNVTRIQGAKRSS